MTAPSSIRSYFIQQRDKKATRWQKNFIAIYLCIGLAGLIAALVYWVTECSFSLLFLLVGIPYTILGFLFTADLRNERACARRMLSALDHNGGDLAWVYLESISGQYIATLLHYHFTDRRHGSLPVRPNDGDALLSYFQTACPQVTTGYTPEIEKRWRRDPRSFQSTPIKGSRTKQTIADDTSLIGI